MGSEHREQAIVRLRLSHLGDEKPLKDIVSMSNWIRLAVKSRLKRRQEWDQRNC